MKDALFIGLLVVVLPLACWVHAQFPPAPVSLGGAR